MCAVLGIGIVALAQFIPPPKASDSAQKVAELYSNHTDRLRAGVTMIMLGGAFFASFSAAIAVQLKRIEGRWSPMAYTQLAAGAANVIAVTISSLVMIVAAFRPDRNPEITQTLNDL